MSTLKAGPVMFAAVYADCPTPPVPCDHLAVFNASRVTVGDMKTAPSFTAHQALFCLRIPLLFDYFALYI